MHQQRSGFQFFYASLVCLLDAALTLLDISFSSTLLSKCRFSRHLLPPHN